MDELLPKHCGNRNFETFKLARLIHDVTVAQRMLHQWQPDHPALERFRSRRCASLQEVLEWLDAEMARTRHRRTPSMNNARITACPSVPLANAALSLLNIGCYLLDQQVRSLAAKLESEGGFTERIYRVRSPKRSKRERE
jgi:four helix bundle suffix protein